MGFSGLIRLFKKRYRIFLFIVLWLLIGILVSTLSFDLGIIILTPLIPLCIVLFAISIITDLRDMSFLIFIIVIIVTAILVLGFFVFRNIIVPFLFDLSIISYIIITAFFTLYACYEGGRNLDEFIYTRFPSPTHHIMRWIEFAGGIALGLLIIWFTFIFTGSQLYLITWIVIITILVLAGIAVLLILTGKFNAWFGTFSLYAGFYFAYLVVAFLIGPALLEQGGTYPIMILVIFALFDIIILLYTVGVLVGERADIISKKIKIGPDTILMWLIFSKASYELAKLLNPLIISFKYWWVLVIFVVLLGIVGFVGIVKYKKFRTNIKRKRTIRKGKK
ncbi:MAG: hypothetical protein ACFE8A_04560 [Candidatus Hodarchaeota archaeon]